MMRVISFTPIRLSAVLATMLLLSPLTANATSQCKGQTQDACVTSSECAWVEGYTRKDGRSVSSYCRSKGGSKKLDEAKADGPRTSAAD